MEKPIHQTLEELLDGRIQELDDKEDKKARSEQRHLNIGTPERVYWHYGYTSALKDVLGILQSTRKPNN